MHSSRIPRPRPIRLPVRLPPSPLIRPIRHGTMMNTVHQPSKLKLNNPNDLPTIQRPTRIRSAPIKIAEEFRFINYLLSILKLYLSFMFCYPYQPVPRSTASNTARYGFINYPYDNRNPAEKQVRIRLEKLAAFLENNSCKGKASRRLWGRLLTDSDYIRYCLM